MAEIVSRQAAKVAAGAKMLPGESYGRKRIITITTPAAHAVAQNDTIASGVPIPIGTRFTCNSIVSHEAMGASVTLDVGIRNFATKTAIDADGIAVSAAVAAAGRTALNTGALVAAGVVYETTEVAELYATFTGANPTDNAQLRIEVEIVTND